MQSSLEGGRDVGLIVMTACSLGGGDGVKCSYRPCEIMLKIFPFFYPKLFMLAHVCKLLMMTAISLKALAYHLCWLHCLQVLCYDITYVLPRIIPQFSWLPISLLA